MNTFRLLCVVVCLAGADGYRTFAARIPNGEQVPHPCKPNVLWHGVGHFNAEGGGFRNPFGMDFDRAGKQWTADLCHKDSDGDGRSNGEELGDPNCVWTPGQMPQRSANLSHPGVCEPMDSESCQNSRFTWGLFHDQREWMEDACKSSDFNCSAIHDKDVLTMEARLDLSPVPAKETTYICQIYDVPDVTQDYHMVAATPLINDSYILHHMALFGCEDSVAPRSAYECDMLPDRKCKMILTVWTLGLNGDCFHPNAGVRIGKNGLKRLALQLHWNNPGRIANFQDNSGLVLHYTPHLRHFDSSMLLLGNEHFSIPPRTPSTLVTSTCSPSCTRTRMRAPVYVTSAFNHMHYLGRKMKMELLRNGTVVRNITQDEVYSYDSPKMYFFDDPIPIYPGDELRTTCDYSSEYKATTTYYGESTAEEMCYGFMSVYPFQAFVRSPFCTTYGGISSCTPETYHGCIGEEEAKYFRDVSGLEIYRNVTGQCRPFGQCTAECLDTILTARATDPCLTSGEVWDRIVEWGLSRNEAGRNFLASLSSCQVELYKLVSEKDVIE